MIMACIYKNKLWDNRWCPVTCFYCTGEQERTCEHNKATNADRIRAMSDEELAENLCDKKLTKEMWMKWLKQPAE
jgi:hypothetical protein